MNITEILFLCNEQSAFSQMDSKKKKKIVNDPVYGFIKIPSELVFDLIEHRYFQRLRRIRQLGLTYLVYPGAIHSRFQHALGAMYLMETAIEVLRSKGHEITQYEAESAIIAILLHDIGHGPFSHTLEKSLCPDVSHEFISLLFMQKMNKEFDGKLSTAIEIFQGKHPKKFLHQLVSSQLDVDRLDYLKRDSFFTGVSEGVISTDRIIKMLEVVNDSLVVESKGIYSIEKFLIARRLMYWQVYLHKTSIAADQMLIGILKRARELAEKGEVLFCTPALNVFLYEKIEKKNFSDENNESLLEVFSLLDDEDILASIKVWASHSDFVLSYLCNGLLNRKLFSIRLQKQPFETEEIERIQNLVKNKFLLDDQAISYLVCTGSASNNAYYPDEEKINILNSNGELNDIASASDMFNLSVIGKTEKKYFLCFPKGIL